VNDFTTAFLVDQTSAEVFEAITDVRGWWSGQIDGHTSQPGDEFTYRYEDLHLCRILVTEADPGQKVTWLVLEGGPAFTRNKEEWRGTMIRFEISQIGGQTEVRFTHRGLIPRIECFGACSSAWGSYINGSLRSLITTGTGVSEPRIQRFLAHGRVAHISFCADGQPFCLPALYARAGDEVLIHGTG